MELFKKLTILADSAKYDVACTSSGSNRSSKSGLGSTVAPGCCHSFSADGRCISLLKVLMTNYCLYDCKYCVNRVSNDVERAAFTPEELAELTIQFYRRNYIEGLFLSSGIIRSPDYTTEQMIKVLELLRFKYKFYGYIHSKTIPGTSSELIQKLGLLSDRMSVNIELPSEVSLNQLAPNKTKKDILRPMGEIRNSLDINSKELTIYKNTPRFAPAGQSTQMIIGASDESDYQILRLSSGLYKNYKLKRVFFSAYIPTIEDKLLPALDTTPPLLREHRLYQADFLMRQYEFKAEEILNEENQNFNPYLDPKCNWAINNMHYFPVDVNTAPKHILLRVPGIGPVSVKKILIARRATALTFDDLRKLGIVMKRAQYFITAKDKPLGLKLTKEFTVQALIDPNAFAFGFQQLSLFSSDKSALPIPNENEKISSENLAREAIKCITKAI